MYVDSLLIFAATLDNFFGSVLARQGVWVLVKQTEVFDLLFTLIYFPVNWMVFCGLVNYFSMHSGCHLHKTILIIKICSVSLIKVNFAYFKL